MKKLLRIFMSPDDGGAGGGEHAPTAEEQIATLTAELAAEKEAKEALAKDKAELEKAKMMLISVI